MNKIKKIITLFFIITAISIHFFVFAEISENLDFIVQAISLELGFADISIKPMGSGNQIILEGSVSSKSSLKKAEEVAKRYSVNVYNILTIKKPEISYSYNFFSYKKSNVLDSSSKLAKIINSGNSIRNDLWHFLLFNQQEKNNLISTLKDNFSASKIFVSKTNKKNNQLILTSSIDKQNEYQIEILSTYLDNDFFKTDLKLKNVNEEKYIKNKQIYSRKGEILVLTGFSIKTDPENPNKNDSLILLLKPHIEQ